MTSLDNSSKLHLITFAAAPSSIAFVESSLLVFSCLFVCAFFVVAVIVIIVENLPIAIIISSRLLWLLKRYLSRFRCISILSHSHSKHVIISFFFFSHRIYTKILYNTTIKPTYQLHFYEIVTYRRAKLTHHTHARMHSLPKWKCFRQNEERS